MSRFELNAEILRNMEADGSDLGPSRAVDFFHVFPTQALADAFARDAQREGFHTTVKETEREEDPWDVTAVKDMVPTCENITDVEERLDDLAQAFRGRADGWGFMRVDHMFS